MAAPAALLVALVLAGPAAADTGQPGSARFLFGVAAGEVRSTSARLWGHADRRAPVTLEVARDRRFRHVVATAVVWALASNDYTVQKRVRRLHPDTRYWYRWRKGRGRSARGTFETAPRSRSRSTVRFAWTGDTDFISAPGQSGPYWNTGGVFRRMRAERNDFNIHLGDTIYSDSEVPGRPTPAVTVRAKWGKYRINLGDRFLRALRRSAGFYSHWDDHDFVNDFSPQESSFSNGFSGSQVHLNGHVLYRRGMRAFRDYSPVDWSRRTGLYRTVRWGRNLELFFLDERSFRSAKADDACINPQTGRPDVAPTLPQSYRSAYGTAFPSSGLAQPVSQACLNAIRSSQRTYLGARQLRAFLRAVRRSRARFKVVMNELPIQQFYANIYDRWEGYEHDRQAVLRALQDVKNLIFLTTDVHATLVNDARFQTLEPGGPRNSGIWDFTVGPAATANLGLEADRLIGSANAGELVRSAVLLPQPPVGVGMRCADIDTFSYGEVRVTSGRLTVTPKDIAGRPLPDCPALTLRYRP